MLKIKDQIEVMSYSGFYDTPFQLFGFSGANSFLSFPDLEGQMLF